MVEHVKLAGIVTEDDQILRTAVVDQATDQSTFGGDAYMPGLSDIQGVQVC